MSKQNTTKPFTANFQLDTKIRTIIQQVLAATIRKLSLFNQKIDKFDDYFMIYKQKIQQIQKNCQQNNETIKKQIQQRNKIKQNITNMVIIQFIIQIFRQQNHNKDNKIKKYKLIKSDKKLNKSRRLQNKFIDKIRHQTNNCQKLKVFIFIYIYYYIGKFLQYSNIISSLKQQVSWKITKYIQQTANTNTQIKINNQQMKKQYFNVILLLQKQKQKYQKIIQMNQNKQNDSKNIKLDIQRLNDLNILRQKQNKKLLQKLDQYDTILQSKIRTVQSRQQIRIVKLQQDNKKTLSSVKSLQLFNEQLQGLRNQQQQIRITILKRIQEMNKKSRDQRELQMIKVNKDMIKLQKNIQKKVNQQTQMNKKSQQYVLSRIQYMRIQIETQLSSKHNTQLQQKQDKSKINTSTMEQITNKINKINIQTRQNMSKIQNTLKDNIKHQIANIKSQIQKIKHELIQKLNHLDFNQIQIQNNKNNKNNNKSDKLSPELAIKINQYQSKINLINQSLSSIITNFHQLQQKQSKQSLFQSQTTRKIDLYFKTQQQQLSTKVQKIMFLITKTRGDTIIRNDFTDKQIKQLKKNSIQSKQTIQTISKLIPAFGQCINLILSLIYDAEYQHSKIIQDNLPVLKKDEQKFNTCVQGILYQYKQKKKSGIICYRHKDVKKTDIVKATFNAYIQIWENLYQNQFKNKLELLPKSFYKLSVEKAFHINENNTNSNNSNNNNKSISPNKQTLYDKMLTNNRFQRIDKHIKRLKTAQKDKYKQQNHYDNDTFNNTLTKLATKQANKSFKQIQANKSFNKIQANKSYKLIQANQSFNKIQEDILDNIQDKYNPNLISNTENIQANNSFYIRKKKNSKKEEIIVLNFP